MSSVCLYENLHILSNVSRILIVHYLQTGNCRAVARELVLPLHCRQLRCRLKRHKLRRVFGRLFLLTRSHRLLQLSQRIFSGLLGARRVRILRSRDFPAVHRDHRVSHLRRGDFFVGGRIQLHGLLCRNVCGTQWLSRMYLMCRGHLSGKFLSGVNVVSLCVVVWWLRLRSSVVVFHGLQLEH